MTTNEQIPCPVCGERMEVKAPFPFGDNNYNIFICYKCDITMSEHAYQAFQLRIDKAKAAAMQVAVQQERERVDKDLNQMELFYQDSCPQNKLSCHATILSIIKEARKVVTKGIQQFNVT